MAAAEKKAVSIAEPEAAEGPRRMPERVGVVPHSPPTTWSRPPQGLLTTGVSTGQCMSDASILILAIYCAVTFVSLANKSCITPPTQQRPYALVKGGECELEAWLGMIFLWTMPSGIFFWFAIQRYRFSASARQTVYVIIEAALYITPMLLSLQFVLYLTGEWGTQLTGILNRQMSRAPGQSPSVVEILERFVGHVLLAGVPEESLKYLCIRRILFSSRAADPSAVVMYGFAAGFGFSITENLMYMFSGFSNVLSQGGSMQMAQGMAYTQAMTRWTVIPMHCVAGILTASCLGRAKFIGDRRKYVYVVWEAIIFHSLFNSLAGTPFQGVVIMGGVFYVRAKLLDLAHVGLVDFHACVEQGLVRPPACLLCEFRVTTPLSQRRSFATRLEPTPENMAALDRLGDAWEATQVVTEPVQCTCQNAVLRHKILPSFCPFCFAPLGSRQLELLSNEFPNL